MALPPPSRLRRTEVQVRIRLPFGGPRPPREIHGFLDRDGNYVLEHPLPRGPFRSKRQLQAAVSAYYIAQNLCAEARARNPSQSRSEIAAAAHASLDSWHQRRHRDPPLSPPCDEEHVSLFYFRCEGEHVAEPTSAQTLQEPDVSSLKELLNTKALEESSATPPSSSSPQSEVVAQDTIKVSPPSGPCLPLSPRSTIWSQLRRYWGLKFYIRVDLGGSFHTYPHLGGPFQSLQEADDAIDRHLHERRQDSKLCMEQDGVSPLDKVVQQCLYWPDGRRKKRTKSHAIEETHKQMCLLVQALVDKYNDDHNLLGDLAYEVKDVLHYQSIYENHIWYFHLNFTTRTKGADGCGIDNLFFVELKCIQGKQEELVVSCFCMVKPTDNGHCYGCTNHGSVDMKHPNNADEYTAGHKDAHLPFGCYERWSDSDEDVETKERKIRRMYEGVYEPDFADKFFTLPSFLSLEDKKVAGVKD